MVTAKDVVAYSKSKLNQKVTVPTNPYGGQCVAFIDHIVQHFSDKNLAYTNAKDTLEKAKQQGLIVIYNDHPDKYPQPGDFIVYVWNASDPFGHIGVVLEASPTGFHTLEQNVDGWKDENGNGENDQLEIGGGGYVRELWRGASDYQYVTGWFRLKYDEPTKKKEDKKGEIDMFTVGAPGRGIALMQGGVFLSFYKPEDPKGFWKQGIPHITVSQTTFDKWQAQSNVSPYDKTMVAKMEEILKEVKK